ncbi:MAG: choice-of-anchor D domain-containing protein [Ignavibacteria bacterium]
MKKLLLLLFFILLSVPAANSQTVVATYPFPSYSQYNSFWGITKIGDTLRIATDNNGSIYKVTTTGLITDSLTLPYDFNHGLEWDGTGYWVAEDFRTAGARLYKVNTAGVPIDSILLPALIGGASGGVGDIALDNGGLWFTIYSPDFTVYPFAYAYKIDLTTRLITDTIPLLGRQVHGIAVKGDTVFYVNDYFHTTPFVDQERIYAYSLSQRDTLFSFAAPDPDGNGNPRGLHWDGQFLWLIGDRIGGTISLYRTLYKYSITGAGNPQITTSVNSLDFGNTIVGTANDRAFTITNTGTSKLIISAYNNTNNVFTINPNNTPDTINPAQVKNYILKFSPIAFGNVTGQLKIVSNDAVTPEKTVNLFGKGVFNGSYIGSSVSTLNYSSRRVNCLSGGYLDITNQGSEPLIINSVTFNSQRFRLDTIGVTFPIVIDTQKTLPMRIWFNPNSATSFNDTAKFNSNAVNSSVLRIPVTGIGQVSPVVLGDIEWQGIIPNNPNTTSNNLKVMSMKEISDVNSDGINDVMISTDNYWTICYNGNSSVTDDILWKFNTRKSSNVSGSVVYEDGMQIMNDINGDGIQDVVIGTGGNNELVFALSGRTGKLLWSYGDSLITSDGDINGMNVSKDYNNDGINDVLVAATGEGKGNGRHAAICLNAVNGSAIFYAVQGGEFTHSITPTSVGGAIDFSSNGGPYGVNGFSNTGGFTWSTTVSSTVWNLKQMQDLNADGVTDIAAFFGFSGSIKMISGNNGAQIWSNDFGQSIDGNIRTLGDIDNNGFNDITFSGPQTLYRVDSRTAGVLWNTGLDNNYIHSVAELSDLTGDGIREIAAGTQNSNIYVVRGDSGQIIFTYSFGSATTNTVEQVASIKSIDGNTSSEFIGGSRSGKVICFDGGPNGVVGITNINSALPEKYSLNQNYPNPFNPSTKIKFDIAGKTQNVMLTIYDAIGREVSVLVNQQLSPGSYESEFRADNFASGIYFYKIEAGEFVDTKRMIILK